MHVRLTGLAPVADARSRLLVLGSMPGGVSLERGEYYAHPRNRFWRLMEDILGVAGTSYDERIAAILDAGIALWDVLKHCDRVGSLDSSIRADSEVPNDLAGFLERHARVRTILLNGGKAAGSFRKHTEPRLSGPLRDRVEWWAVPSTSPANTTISFPDLLAVWRDRIPAAGHAMVCRDTDGQSQSPGPGRQRPGAQRRE
jgi:hypoxanthine-DNA glycosylase